MSHLDVALIAIKTGTLLLGSLITFLSLKAYSRTGSRSLRSLGIGFGLVTVGALLAGVGHQFTSLTLAQSVVIESTLTLLGFVVIVYSLYGD
ncbi:hypothetical protein DU500_14230 [Haloplanus rubicundus]|uniref:Uncharacterized protein n=1 Tax=Haloplanus rubicundus TaxID=1547898 RepID=A0A345E5L7_9EURY|nr:hypothetical protein [Haloplanus rubicundus]AXG07489.1 hypothetical protein DU500_14230 [Haloplanus rubicundus]AXG10904.1 hypothetical protein DU484_14200 [Haloplanus rubicundus]